MIKRICKNLTRESLYEVINRASSWSEGMKLNSFPKIRKTPEREIMGEGIDYESDSNKKGGIITFSTDINAKALAANKIVNWIKQKIETLKQCLTVTKKVDKIDAKHELVGWTIGHYLDGRYTAKNGKQYGENSLSLEIVGIDLETLIKIAEEMCIAFNQESVLVKDYSSNRVFFVNPEKTNNFVHEVHGRESFNCTPLVPINETNAKRLLDRHTKDGYIAISPCRGFGDFGLDNNNPTDVQKWREINAKRIKECAQLIKDSGFSYTPVYGGFIENQGTPQEEEVYERTFIVYPYTKKGELRPFEELKQLGLELAGQYNQDSVMVVAPNETPAYYAPDGSLDMELGQNVAFNDLSQTYFTDLHKNTGKTGLKGSPTRFSYVESYINPAPQCISEAHMRSLDGEIFLNYKNPQPK